MSPTVLNVLVAIKDVTIRIFKVLFLIVFCCGVLCWINKDAIIHYCIAKVNQFEILNLS